MPKVARPKLDPATLRWVAEQLALRSIEYRERSTRIARSDHPLNQDVASRHDARALTLRDQAKRFRAYATKEARRG